MEKEFGWLDKVEENAKKVDRMFEETQEPIPEEVEAKEDEEEVAETDDED